MLQWKHIEALPEFQAAPPDKRRAVKALWFEYYPGADERIPEETKRAFEREFVNEGHGALAPGGGDANFLEKALGLVGLSIPRRLPAETRAKAVVDLQAREEGVSPGEFRTGPEAFRQFAGRAVDAFALGIPGALSRTATGDGLVPEADTKAGQIGAGAGELAGFVAGLPGAAAGTAARAVGGRLPGRMAGSLAGRVGAGVATRGAGLAAGTAARNVGEAVQAAGPVEALGTELRAMGEGAATGAIFGAAGQIPNRLARLSAGIAGLEAQRAAGPGTHVFDDRPLEEKAFDIAQSVFFLWKYGGPTVARSLSESLRREGYESFRGKVKSEGQRIRETLRSMSPEQRAAYMDRMQRQWTGKKPPRAGEAAGDWTGTPPPADAVSPVDVMRAGRPGRGAPPARTGSGRVEPARSAGDSIPGLVAPRNPAAVGAEQGFQLRGPSYGGTDPRPAAVPGAAGVAPAGLIGQRPPLPAWMTDFDGMLGDSDPWRDGGAPDGFFDTEGNVLSEGGARVAPSRSGPGALIPGVAPVKADVGGGARVAPMRSGVGTRPGEGAVKGPEADRRPWEMTRAEYYRFVRETEGAGPSNRRDIPDWDAVRTKTGLEFEVAGQREIQPARTERVDDPRSFSKFTPEEEAALKLALEEQGFGVDKYRVRRGEEQPIPDGMGWRIRSKDLFETSPEHERGVRRAISEGREVPPEVMREYPELAKSERAPGKPKGPGKAAVERKRAGSEAKTGGELFRDRIEKDRIEKYRIEKYRKDKEVAADENRDSGVGKPVVDAAGGVDDFQRARADREPVPAEPAVVDKQPGRDGDAGDSGRKRPEKTRGPGTARDPGAGVAGSGGAGSAPRRGTQTAETDGGRSGRPDSAVGGKSEAKGARKQNHVIESGDVIAPAGTETKIRANAAAIRIAKTKDAATLTPEDRKALAQWTGWGAFAQKVFRKEFDLYARSDRTTTPEAYFGADEARKYREWESKYGKAFHPELGGSMTAEEWKSAAGSTLNAHYTSREVIAGVWNLIRRLGFSGGTVLEPSAGVGHFFGLMPEMPGPSKLMGVELDAISGRILGLLYPEAEVQVTGFEKAKGIANNSVDLVVSNFPFGNYKVYDRSRPEMSKWSIHNYFFGRSLDAVRPGGLVVGITSHFTLDAKSGGPVREALGRTADFVGAIRLPRNAFDKSAGTEVVTDIIVFRKKDSDRIGTGEDFRLSMPLEIDGEEAFVNEYFIRHPEMVLGKHSMAGSMYGSNEYTVLPDGDLSGQLAEAVKRFPEGIAGEGAAPARPTDPGRIAAADEKEGVLVESDGEFTVIEDGRHVEPWIPDAKGGKSFPLRNNGKRARAAQYLDIRETVKKLVDRMGREDATDAEIVALQRELNEKYDFFVKAFKPFNGTAFNGFLGKIDLEFPIVDALEIVREDVVNGKKVVTVEKAPIFTERTVFPFQEPDKAETLEDAARVSMVYRSTLDPAFIARLLGRDIRGVRAELIRSARAFENPETGRLESRDQYLSGNVKRKLREARVAAKENPDAFRANIEALEKAQPAELDFEFVSFRAGSEWVPADAYRDFLKEVMEVAAAVSRRDIGETTMSEIVLRGPNSVQNTKTWGAAGKPGTELLQDLMNQKRAQIYRTELDADGNERRVKDPDMTAEAQLKQKEIDGEFQDWIRRSEWPEKLAEIYNEKFNGFVVRKFEPPDIEYFPNASRAIRLRPHQKRAVARGLQESTMFAYGVGTGKTFIYISLAMEMRRIGTARKPLIVAHNSTVEQYRTSFRVLYPAAKVLIPDWRGRTAKMRKKTLTQISAGDWDAVVLPQTFFDRISVDPARERAFIQEQLDLLDAAIREEEASGEDNKWTVKSLERMKKDKEARLEKMLDRSMDEAVSWESMGVDALLIDEAHEYKRGEFYTKMTQVKGIDASASQRSTSLLLKAAHVREKTGGKNVILATGTPISNTTAELWTMMRYYRPELLAEYGVDQFDRFATAFGDTTLDLEETAAGTFKEVERFNRYVNGPELLTMFHQATDVILTRDSGLKLPEIRGGKPMPRVVPRSRALEAYIGQIRREWESWEALPGREKAMASHVPLVLFGKARKAAIDLRLVDPGMEPEGDTKLDAVADEVFRIWKATAARRGTQVIFLDMFAAHQKIEYIDAKGKKRTKNGKLLFSAYDYIRDELTKRGIPPEEVLDIGKAKDDTQRETMFQKIRSGRARVIIGSTSKLGVGVDMPHKMVAAHHVDVPMRPMDMEQRNGRIVRQGNENAEVEIINYVAERTLDSTNFDRLVKKQRFIDQMLTGKLSDRSFDDPFSEEQGSFSDMMAAASGEHGRIIKERTAADRRVKELRREKKAFERKVSESRGMARAERKAMEDGEARLEKAAARAEMLADLFPSGLGDVLYGGERLSRAEFAKRLGDDMASWAEAPVRQYSGKKYETVRKARKEGRLDGTWKAETADGGLEIEVSGRLEIRKDENDSVFFEESPWQRTDVRVKSQGASVLEFQDYGNVIPTFTRRFNRAVDDAIDTPGRIERGLEKSRKALYELDRLAGERFAKDSAMHEAEAELRRLNKELMEIGTAETGEESAGDVEGGMEAGSEGRTPGGGGGTTLYSGIPLPEILKLAKKFKGVVAKEDMTLLERHTAIPSWMSDKYPELRPIYDLVQERRRMKGRVQNAYLSELLPSWQALSPAERDRVGELLWKGDEKQRVLTPAGLAKLTPAERAAYETTREVLDYIWSEDMPTLMGELYGLPRNRVEQLKRSMGSIAGWMPHRRKGRYFGKASDPRSGRTVWREHFDDFLETASRGRVGWRAPRVLRKLEARFPGLDVQVGEVMKRVSDDAFFQVSTESVHELLEAALRKVRSGGGVSPHFEDVFRDAMERAVADMWKAMGFMEHGIRRRNVPGWDASNWQDAILEYVAGYAGWKAKMVASKRLATTWGGIDWSRRPVLRGYAEKYLRDSWENEGAVDRAVARVRGALFYKFLGGVVKSAVVNLTQNYMAFVPRMTLETSFPEARITAEMARSAADVVAALWTAPDPGKTRRQSAKAKRLTPEESRYLNRARENGTVSDQWTEELMGQLPGEYGSRSRAVGRVMKFMFGSAEIFNRETAGLTAFRVAKRRGWTFDRSADWADRIVEQTHYTMGKTNLPPFARGGDFAKWARSGYQFRGYMHNTFHLWSKLGHSGWRGKFALAKAFGALLLFGGISSLPFWQFVEEKLQKATGRNVRDEIAELAGEYSRYIFYGVPEMIGVDLSGSLGTGVPTSVSDLIGVPWSLWDESGKMVGSLRRGDVYRAVEDAPVMPMVGKNLMKGWRYYERGIESRSGRPVLDEDWSGPIRLGADEAVLKGILGFQPSSVSEHYRKDRAAKIGTAYWADRKRMLRDRFLVAYNLHGPDSAQVAEVERAVERFNEKIPEWVAPITGASFRRWTTEKPGRREAARREDFQ